MTKYHVQDFLNTTGNYMGILDCIGETPITELKKCESLTHIELFAKLEFLNPGGSIKDRTSLNILKGALENKEVNSFTTIIESSSGNMAIGLAQFCCFHGLNLKIVVDPFALKSNVELIKTYGADVITVDEPCPENGWLGARINKIKELQKVYKHSYWPNQYQNKLNPKAHYDTMKEFCSSLAKPLDYIFIATSTCGTLMGCADYIKENNLPTKIIAVDAAGSVIFGGKPGKRMIPGHGASKPSFLLDTKNVDDVVHVTDMECVDGCHQLLKKEAILSGGSSGGVYSAIQKYARKIKPGSRCGMLICDRGERYIDTIYNEEWVRENLSPKLESIIYAA